MLKKKVRISLKTPLSVPVSLGTRSYPILIGSGMIHQVGEVLNKKGFTGKIGVVTDSIVNQIYGGTVVQTLEGAGFQVERIVLPPGEKTKSLRWVHGILDRLVRRKFERGSLLLALGGGVIGDITGFAASIFVRGIPFVQVPTTMIAQVDSSVGGKTGVNHPLGKNLIGTFYQPKMVIIDPDTLFTLPQREFAAGLAEVIKYGMIEDGKFFKFLERQLPLLQQKRTHSQVLLHIIRRSCQIKAKVVGEDERETNRRRILNYGHTIGHAFEALGKYRTFIHGEAVAIGMVLEAELAHHLGFCSRQVVMRQRALVEQVGLMPQLPSVTGRQLWATMMRDKKVVQEQVYCVFPARIGEVTIAPVQPSIFKSWYQQRLKG